MKINRICILGHSGIGKTNLADLFNVKGWEPYRVRAPRNPTDLAISETEFKDIQSEHRTGTIYEGVGFQVYGDLSILKVRGADQVLKHIPEAKSDELLRVEIFAPILVQMLKNSAKFASAFSLEPSRTLVILLNPTATSFEHMNEPSQELRLATAFAIAERYRTTGAAIDLADILRRVEHLREELSAWREIFSSGALVVEIREWQHFEYRYHATGDSQAEARRARQTLSKAIEGDAESKIEVLRALF